METQLTSFFSQQGYYMTFQIPIPVEKPWIFSYLTLNILAIFMLVFFKPISLFFIPVGILIFAACVISSYLKNKQTYSNLLHLSCWIAPIFIGSIAALLIILGLY
jgi:hypothetical protein